MSLRPFTLRGEHVLLEPLHRSHRAGLIAAAADGELWNLTVTIVPSATTVDSYLADAEAAVVAGRELPFVIRSRATGEIVGTTRYRNIALAHRRLEIGSTWLAASAQRTAINTNAKLLLLAHAFEALGCNRVEFLTDALNTRSRAAIARLGATEEGTLRQHMVMPDGRVRDSVLFSIVAQEWPAIHRRLAERLARGV